jgi:hypothetical protein
LLGIKLDLQSRGDLLGPSRSRDVNLPRTLPIVCDTTSTPAKHENRVGISFQLVRHAQQPVLVVGREPPTGAVA